jgi:hypothetical protein
VVQSEEEDQQSHPETDVTGDDGDEDFTLPRTSGALLSASWATKRNRSSEEPVIGDDLGEPHQSRNVRQSPRIKAGGRGSVPSTDAVATDLRSGIKQNGYPQPSLEVATPSISNRKRPSRTTVKPIAEPDLVMPSIHEHTLRGSWLGDEKAPLLRISAKARRTVGDSTRREKTGFSRFEESKAQERLEQSSKTIVDMATSIGGWIIDVIGKALSTLKTPISFILAGYILVGLLLVMRNLLTSSIYAAISPVCRIPGSSFLHLPMCQAAASVKYQGSEPPPVHFDHLMTVQSKFEAVLEESAGGVSLPLDMKRGEASIRDLRQIVRHSGASLQERTCA